MAARKKRQHNCSSSQMRPILPHAANGVKSVPDVIFSVNLAGKTCRSFFFGISWVLNTNIPIKPLIGVFRLYMTAIAFRHVMLPIIALLCGPW
jgi:hypothetical protein